MTTKETLRFREKLLVWYKMNQRLLPWRETDDPYRIWVSEVMLQQTKVHTVLNYYPAFTKRFPDVRVLAGSDLEGVLKAWEGLGYYARARNLHKAAGIVEKEMAGEIPSDYRAFRSLPGVGDYIAAAVMSIAFSLPYPVVDGNVKRVLSRVFMLDSPVSGSRSKRIFEDRAEALLNPVVPGHFNQAMMELGALVCRPQEPDCTVCPVEEYCQANRAGRWNDYPVRKKARAIPERNVAVGIIARRGRFLITRRPTEGLLGGLWEFPGGKVREGEKAEDACIREIKEETGLDVEVERYLTRIHHAYSHFKIVMEVFYCHYLAGDVVLNGPIDSEWIGIEEIDRYAFPGANHKFIPLLKRSVDSLSKEEDGVEERGEVPDKPRSIDITTGYRE